MTAERVPNHGSAESPSSSWPNATAKQPAQPTRILRVTQLTRYLSRLLEKDTLLADISVGGEVTNLSQPSSGHVYFTLKDENSQLPCIMMRNQAQRNARVLPGLRNGITVIAQGTVSVYEPTGKYQLGVRMLQIHGAGQARLRFERLRQQLEGEGLFSPERKRSLPPHPKTIALLTAPKSEAYHDVVKRLQLQWPHVKVIVAGVSVQGEQAPGEIELALDLVNRMTDAEVILLVRGGGSAEDLSAFNDERVARAIFASRVPVITGIGHTQDLTIADMVADVRATTPSVAASQAVPDGQALIRASRTIYSQARTHVHHNLRVRRQRLNELEQTLLRSSPARKLQDKRQRLDELWVIATNSMTGRMQIRRERLTSITSRLQSLNPTAFLDKGYALLTDVETGSVVSSRHQARVGRMLNARVRDGDFAVKVSDGS